MHRDLLDPTAVQLAADVLDDLERVRMANAARYGALTGFTPDGKPWKPDKDEVVRSAGMAPDHPAAVRFLSIFDALKTIEADAVKGLEKAMAAHPMGAWVKAQRGLGMKQAGRLLAAIGDPYWRFDTDAPRTVSALWAYSGLHVADGKAVKRQKGVKSNWSTNAKTRAYLCAESCLKQLDRACKGGGETQADEASTSAAAPPQHTDDCRCSPFRVAYDRRRAATAPELRDAAGLEAWTLGHRHTDAMRYASKEILKAFWIEARRLHVLADPDLLENPPLLP